MIIRRYEVEDTKAIMRLFYDTVHEINIKDYSTAQVEAWAPRDMNYEAWSNRLQGQITYVAENNGCIAGFGQLEENGHIDCFYCHKNYQRQGVGSKLLQAIEEMAKSISVERLFTEASITAKPFFESKGFKTVRQQEVKRQGETFINYVMEKRIKGSAILSSPHE